MLIHKCDRLQDTFKRRGVLRRRSLPSDFGCLLKTARMACTDRVVVPDKMLAARLLGAASGQCQPISLQDSQDLLLADVVGALAAEQRDLFGRLRILRVRQLVIRLNLSCWRSRG